MTASLEIAGVEIRLIPGPRPTMVFVKTDAEGCATEWWTATARGWRDLAFEGAEVGKGTSVAAALAKASAAVAGRRYDLGTESTDADLQDHTRRPRTRYGTAMLQADANERTAAFFAVCGKATLAACIHHLPISELRAYDTWCGPDATEKFFARWPFLLVPFFSLGIQNTGQNAGLGYRAVAAATTDAAAAASAAIKFRIEMRAGLFPPEEGGLTAGERVAALRLLMRHQEHVPFYGEHRMDRTLALAARVPADWMPKDAAGMQAFVQAADKVIGLHAYSDQALDVATLAASCRGRWEAFRNRLPPSHPADVRDMVAAFVGQVAHPAVLHALAFRNPAMTDDPLLRHRITSVLMSPPGIDAFCWKLLFGGKSAPTVLEASEDWHRAEDAMRRAIGTVSHVGWPVPFAAMDLGGGLRIVPISDSTSLATEGAMLRHCVGGYWQRCASRESVVASICMPQADGTQTRLSTVEFTPWQPGLVWDPEVVQHRGVGNSAPPASCDLAVMRFLAAWRAGDRVAIGRADDPAPAMPDGDVVTNPAAVDRVSQAAGYSWGDPAAIANAMRQWASFLPRDVAREGPAFFGERIESVMGARPALEFRNRMDASIEGFLLDAGRLAAQMDRRAGGMR